MSHYLKVTSRGAIMACNPRGLVQKGTKLSKEQCESMFGGAAEVDRLVDQGFLVRLTEQVDREEHVLPPQTTVAPPHPHNIEKDQPAMETTERGGKTANAPVVKGTATLDPVPTGEKPWNLDPSTLADKDVHELNVMIQERGFGEVPTFETAEEARAWLSQDFVEDTNVATG